MDLAREGMENFVKAQKRFMDVVAEETAKATGGKHTNGAGKKMKQTELSGLARKATDAFIEAQKRLVDVAGRQMDANVKTAGKTLELLKPFPFLPVNELTREAVKSYVDAQKALMDVMVKPTGPKAERPARKTVKRSQSSYGRRLVLGPDEESSAGSATLEGLWLAARSNFTYVFG